MSSKSSQNTSVHTVDCFWAVSYTEIRTEESTLNESFVWWSDPISTHTAGQTGRKYSFIRSMLLILSWRLKWGFPWSFVHWITIEHLSRDLTTIYDSLYQTQIFWKYIDKWSEGSTVYPQVQTITAIAIFGGSKSPAFIYTSFVSMKFGDLRLCHYEFTRHDYQIWLHIAINSMDHAQAGAYILAKTMNAMDRGATETKELTPTSAGFRAGISPPSVTSSGVPFRTITWLWRYPSFGARWYSSLNAGAFDDPAPTNETVFFSPRRRMVPLSAGRWSVPESFALLLLWTRAMKFVSLLKLIRSRVTPACDSSIDWSNMTNNGNVWPCSWGSSDYQAIW